MSGDFGTVEGVGDNLEFNVATASDVTVYFNGGSSGSNTSANDTATAKYSDNYGTVKAFQIRNNKNIQLVQINEQEFTDPISLTAALGAIEKFDTAIVYKMVLRTLTTDTNIKIRFRGR